LQLGDTVSAKARSRKITHSEKSAVLCWIIDMPNGVDHHAAALAARLDDSVNKPTFWTRGKHHQTGVNIKLGQHCSDKPGFIRTISAVLENLNWSRAEGSNHKIMLIFSEAPILVDPVVYCPYTRRISI